MRPSKFARPGVRKQDSVGSHGDGGHKHTLFLEENHERNKTLKSEMIEPAPCCDFTSLVARSIQTIRHPVTLGSSVPL